MLLLLLVGIGPAVREYAFPQLMVALLFLFFLLASVSALPLAFLILLPAAVAVAVAAAAAAASINLALLLVPGTRGLSPLRTFFLLVPSPILFFLPTLFPRLRVLPLPSLLPLLLLRLLAWSAMGGWGGLLASGVSGRGGCSDDTEAPIDLPKTKKRVRQGPAWDTLVSQ